MRSAAPRDRRADRRPRLLLLVTLAEVGGAQTYVRQLVEAMRDDFDVTVAAWGPGPLRHEVQARGASYVELRNVRRELGWRDALGLLELVRLCRRVRPDIVHANSSKAGILGRLAASATRVPIRLFTAHGWAFNAHSGVPARVYRWADRAMRPLTSAVICVSEQERSAGIAAGVCDADETEVISNAVALPAPASQAERGTPVVVSIGRLKPPKDFATLVHALARVAAPYRALVVGDGPERDHVTAAVRAEGLADRVELSGTRDDVGDVLAGADLFVLSSRSEGMPMSVLEAMAAGLPVVATAVGGVPEVVVDGETGILVPPGDVQALADAIQRLLEDAALRARMGAAGRRRAKTSFALPAWAAAHRALYARLLGERGLPLPQSLRVGTPAHA
jgi:glycosyltransferase involved in cell wall biosynthesis